LFLLADRLGRPAGSNGGTGVSAGTLAPATPAPRFRSPREVVDAFVERWTRSDYAAMYELLSEASQAHISKTSFVARYEGIAEEMGQRSIEVTVGDAPSGASRVPIHVVRQTDRVGTLAEENAIPVVQEDGEYRIDWTPSLIVADLADGFVRWIPSVPQRGRILDRRGRPLAHLGTVTKVGVIPGQIQDEHTLLERLSQLLELPPEAIQQRYRGGQPDWFMPIKSLPDPIDPELLQQLAGIPGVVVRQWPERVYPAGPAAAHVTGYLTEVTAEDLQRLASSGYEPGDRIGRAGIEAWGEQYLRGRRGGRLVILGPDGRERKVLAERPSQPAADVVTTIDLDLQLAAYQALGDRTGSIVVLDPTSGSVLALVSNPSFDPNQFILGLTHEQWAALNDEQRRPLLDRATQVGYPIGSTFKVVTMAAGMHYGGLTAQTVFDCPATFSLPGSSQVWRDWSPQGQGRLSLHNALVQSCNTVFFQIGAELDSREPNLLPQMARAFGFGSETGIPELPEVAGLVPDPQWKLRAYGDYWARGDAVNLAIGQGFFLATPLQVVGAYAALANGGTLWQPYLVHEVIAIDGTRLYSAQPRPRGTLPVGSEIQAAIRAALFGVTAAPNGTATASFQGVAQPVAGKTGTAESGQEQPHAWFTAFTPVDGARMALVVMVEHGGEGSRTAAPIARQVIDAAIQAGVP
jgi:penicillin-binding protein 2